MKGGVISGNSADAGGGVYGREGMFFKFGNGGVIYGSNAPEAQANTARYAAAVCAATFSGSKRRDATARATTMMDSGIAGAEGGWE